MFETILRAPDAARIDGRPAEAEGGRFALGDVRVEPPRGRPRGWRSPSPRRKRRSAA